MSAPELLPHLTCQVVSHLQSIQTAQGAGDTDALRDRTQAAIRFLKELPEQRSSYEGSMDERIQFYRKFNELCNALTSTSNAEKNVEIGEIAKKISQITRQKLRAQAPDVELILQRDVANRQAVEVMRATAKQQIEEGVAAGKVAHDLSTSLSEFVANLYSQAIQKYGDPPCKFSLVVLGSLGRLESGPFPDLDNILILEKKTPESIGYFWRVHQEVADMIYRLGESGELGMPGFRTCEEGNLNPLFMRYEQRQSSFGQEMRELLQETSSIDKGKNQEERLLSLESKMNQLMLEEKHRGRPALYGQPVEGDPTLKHGTIYDSRHILGDPDLFESHLALVTSQESTDLKEAIKGSIKQIEENEPPSPYAKSELPKILNVKDQLYRYPQTIISNLARLHGIRASSTSDRIRALRDMGVIDNAFADELVETMEHLLKLRIQVQLHYGAEREYVSTVPLDQIPSVKKAAEMELDRLRGQYPGIESQFEACDQALKRLRAEDERSNPQHAEELAKQESLWNELVKIFGPIWYLRDVCLAKEIPFVERSQAVLDAHDVDVLTQKSIPAVRRLTELARRFL